jgi:hypothetical protein
VLAVVASQWGTIARLNRLALGGSRYAEQPETGELPEGDFNRRAVLSKSVVWGSIVARATGDPMTMAPYLAYLHRKYGDLYGIPQS